MLFHMFSLCHCECKGKVLAHGVHSNLNASYVSNLKSYFKIIITTAMYVLNQD